jgi:hypothetical protein
MKKIVVATGLCCSMWCYTKVFEWSDLADYAIYLAMEHRGFEAAFICGAGANLFTTSIKSNACGLGVLVAVSPFCEKFLKHERADQSFMLPNSLPWYALGYALGAGTGRLVRYGVSHGWGHIQSALEKMP